MRDQRVAHELIEQRESQLKGKLARLTNANARERWNENSGTAQMDYRWGVTRDLLKDIFDGLALVNVDEESRKCSRLMIANSCSTYCVRSPVTRCDYALGTTFTLDLHSLMQVPVAFLHQAGVLRRENGELDPLTILESLRRFANKLTVFAQAGYIKLPTNLPRLAALLEPCVCQVRAPREGGLFHPKVWVLRFQRSSPATNRSFDTGCSA